MEKVVHRNCASNFTVDCRFAVYDLFILKQGSTFTEQKGAFLEQIQELNELATAEAYTKVIIERQDNTLFGQSIGFNLPGTKRQLLVVIPGSVKAGVDISGVTEKDVVIDEENKTAKLTLPPATFLGEQKSISIKSKCIPTKVYSGKRRI